MTSGYWGRVLRVDLDSGRLDVEETDDTFQRRYVGGAGYVAHYLLQAVPKDADPLGPENVLVFAGGPLTGQPLGGAGRNCVGAKSPLTGAAAKSEAGGHWGAELKKAGYDGIVVTGRADRPVYLWIHDGEAELRDATHLWGHPTKESQEAICAELGDRLIRTAQIGPGGENLVRFACVINDLKDAAGRAGTGAVMGSKNLKAIAVRGRGAPAPADPEKVRAMGKWLAANYARLTRTMHELGTGAGMVGGNLTGNLPTRNFRDGFFAETEKISVETLRDTIRIGMEGCFACPIRCKKVVQVPGPKGADPAYGGPEYETLAALGSNCGVSDLVALARGHHLCNAYSLDTISTGGTVAFAMECFENGLLTKEDTDGLELRFGSAEAMLRVVEMIAHRRGLGDLLAEGSLRAAQRLGRGAESLAMQVKGLELAMHEPRLKQGLGLGYAMAINGADHGTGLHDTAIERPGAGLDGFKPLGVLDPLPIGQVGTRKAAALTDIYRWRMFVDSAVMCYFLPYHPNQVAEMVNAVTGWNTTVWEAMKLGERVITMFRAFNLREGLTAADDRLPERFFSPTTEGALKATAIDAADFAAARRAYYSLMGWDPETGVPTEVKLAELGVEWVADALRCPS